MFVTLKPVGREEYALSLDGPPVFSTAIFGGYEQAQIQTQLDLEQNLNALGGRLRIHGETGIVWQGIVTRRPGASEPLLAQGWGLCATFGRREALFCDTSVSEWRERTKDARDTTMTCDTDPAQLRITLEAGGSYTGYNGFWRTLPYTTSGVLSFSWARGSENERVHVWEAVAATSEQSDGTEYASGYAETEVAPYGSGGFSGTHTLTFSNADMVGLGCNANGYNVATTNSVRFYNIKLYGVAGVTSATNANVIDNILDNEVDTDYLPAGDAYRAWIAADTTTVEPLVFDSCDAATKISELTKFAAYDYGWYTEMVAGEPACVPHWTARSTTPDYIVRLDEAESYDLEESALDELVSVTRVNYSTVSGKSVYTDVADTDTTHPLVALGITRYGDISAQTNSSTVATTIGQLNNAERGRLQTKGSVTTRVVRSAYGTEVYLPDIRGGQMVRLMGLADGQRDVIVKRATFTRDGICNLELDNEGYRLDVALAKLAKRES